MLLSRPLSEILVYSLTAYTYQPHWMVAATSAITGYMRMVEYC